MTIDEVTARDIMIKALYDEHRRLQMEMEFGIIKEESNSLQLRLAQARKEHGLENSTEDAKRALSCLAHNLMGTPTYVDRESCSAAVSSLVGEVQSMATIWRSVVKKRSVDGDEEIGDTRKAEPDEERELLQGLDCSEVERKIYNNLKISSKLMFERISESTNRMTILTKRLELDARSEEVPKIVAVCKLQHEQDVLLAKTACKKNLELAALIALNKSSP